MSGARHYGDSVAREVSGRFGGAVATKAAIKAMSAKDRVDGMVVLCDSDESLWVFRAASDVDEDGADELVLEPSAGNGRFLRLDKVFVAKLPIAAATEDAAALLTVPAGFAVRVAHLPFWEVTTNFTGGSSSAIGVSTDKTGYDTKGDLLGGASGNVAAALEAGLRPGTIGAELDTLTKWQALLLVEDDVVRFDRITSAFTAGAGFVHLPLLITSAPISAE